jgi:hypothetical protein
MSLRTTIQALISENRQDIIQENDWFYALDNHEVNIHDYDEDGVFSVVVYPRRGGVTDWSQEYHVPSLNFSA